MASTDPIADSFHQLLNRPVTRKKLLATASGAAGVAAAGAVLPHMRHTVAFAATRNVNPSCGDTPTEIFTAALIAEDLATTFYYNGLINLGHMLGNVGNVDYIRAALDQEIQHADLFRKLLGIPNPGGDPNQTFYFASTVFSQVPAFLMTLEALEDAFIGAYINAIREFAALASATQAGATYRNPASGGTFSAAELDYLAEVSGTILGVESEHRVLGRVIASVNPANNYRYEQTDGITSVYNGPHSAVVALTPFLNQGPGLTGYSLQTALMGSGKVLLTTTGTIPNPTSACS
jgi:hypothetical protein